jgi:putative ABC transport system permease protein
MWELTLGQMRASRSRLVAAGLAIVIGTGFLAATLSSNAILEAGLRDTITARYAQADLVATNDGPNFTLKDNLITKLEDQRSIAAAAFAEQSWAWPSDLSTSTGLPITVSTPARALQPFTLLSGALPTTDREIAIAHVVAKNYDLAIGDTLRLDGDDHATDWTITGTVGNRGPAFSDVNDISVVTPAGFNAARGQGDTPTFSTILIDVAEGASVDDTVTLAHKILGADSRVRTRHAAADAAVAAHTGNNYIFGKVLVAFAILALVVTGLVIANTFAVLVAQRTRTLALLRCVGADIRQIRRTVLIEGMLLGFGASVLGVVSGFACAQAALLIMARVAPSVPLPATVPVTALAVIAPVIAGTFVTVVACLLPAREATRIKPLAALRPEIAQRGKATVGPVRRWGSLTLAMGGFTLLGTGVAIGDRSPTLGLALGVLGGAVSFLGVAWGAVLWLVPASRALAVVVRRGGPEARLAAANALRNPRRTAATSTALLIGTTLVSMMTVGATTASATLTHELDAQFPFDAIVNLYAPDGELPTTAEITATTTHINAVTDVAAAAGALLISQNDVSGITVGGNGLLALNDPNPDVLKRLGIDKLPDGTVTVSRANVDRYGIEAGTKVIIGSGLQAVTRTLRVVDGTFTGAVTGPVDPKAVSVDDTLAVCIVTYADGANVNDVVAEIDNAVSASHWTNSMASERGQIETVISVMLAFVVGLLAVAIVIALIGVTNTLSLSVLERKRETATLRSIGLSARQLRSMLAVEGIFIALVGTLCGIGLGFIYGWAGSLTVLMSFAHVVIAVPWLHTAIIIAVGVSAGLLASLIPARSAMKDSPVEALGIE